MTSTATKRAKAPKGKPGTTTDDFLGGRIQIVQPKSGHRAGSDAVFLAAAVPVEKGARVLEAGAGVGVAGLCLLARLPMLEVTAVEVDQDLCALARENAGRNGFADRFTAIEADVTAPAKLLRTAGLVREGYDHVIANPPYFAEGAVRAAPEPARAVAHVMGHGQLGRWVRFLTTMAAPKATLTLIHRPEYLGELLGLLQGRFGDVAVFPLFPKAHEPATRDHRARAQRKPGRLASLAGPCAARRDGRLYGGSGRDPSRRRGAFPCGPTKKEGPPPRGIGRQPSISPEREESSRARKVRK